ncbi:MAG: hypothetical protein V1754_09465 [Pseudomonadota bacterium]
MEFANLGGHIRIWIINSPPNGFWARVSTLRYPQFEKQQEMLLLRGTSFHTLLSGKVNLYTSDWNTAIAEISLTQMKSETLSGAPTTVFCCK